MNPFAVAGPTRRWGGSRAALILAAAIVLMVGCGDEPSHPQTTGPEASPAAELPRRATRVARSGRTNLILITLDTVRADALGTYGQALPTTPEIDRMASEGVVFDQAMTASPSTLPSHATIMTGLFPPAHGVRSNAGYALHDDQTTLAEILSGRGYVTAAEVAAPVIGRRTGIAQGFAHYREPADFDADRKQLIVADPNAPGGQRVQESYDRDGRDITKRGLEFIDAHADAQRPFFLWLHYFDPHADYQAPAQYTRGLESSPYHAEIRYADHQVGRILSRLREQGLRERTLVVLTADHGESLGEHGEETHAYFVYESTMHVPLIFWGAGGLPAGARVETLVRTADLVPTILASLGLRVPPIFQGEDLGPLIKGDASAKTPGPGYGESIEPLALFGSSMLRTIREGAWKYIHKLEPELYRVDGTAEGAAELSNQAAANPEQLALMQAALGDFVEKTARETNAQGGIDAAQRAQLQALGYLGVEAPEGFSDAEDFNDLKGPDPTATMADLEGFLAAHAKNHAGDAAAAVVDFRALLARHPESLAVRAGLLDALVAAEHWEAIPAVAEPILSDQPTNLKAAEALGAALSKKGDDAAALAHWRYAAEVFSCDSGMNSRLGYFLLQRGLEAERVEALEQALARCPREVALLNDLSFALSTSPVVELRDGERALALATQAVQSEHGERPDFLDTLACAQARTGDFTAAIATIDRAESIARKRDLPAAAFTELAEHRRAFEAGHAIGD